MIDTIRIRQNRSMRNSSWCYRKAWLIAAVCALITGCGSKTKVQLEEYLDEIEYVTPLNSTMEVPFGQYSIPIVARPALEEQSGPRIEWVRLQFDLYAVVAVEDEEKISKVWESRRGQFRDETINICRGATIDDVVDLRLATIKSRLTDLARSIFGSKRIRQLLCTNIITQAV